MRFMRKYDYQRAKCEDLKAISEWFAFMYNTEAKYSILKNNTFNFNEIGFIIGIIIPSIIVTTSNGYISSRPK